jgi:hypothetical protein
VKRDEVHGFGAARQLGTHRFLVNIPTSTRDSVEIIEDFGYLGGRDGIPDQEPRATVARSTWNVIRDAARRDFNPRLRKKKLPAGAWAVGANPLDHLLGKELCVLAWATEDAEASAVRRAAVAWSSFRPEERWWLFSITVTHGGRPADQFAGWRTALRVAFQEDTSDRKKVRRPKEPKAEAGKLFL